MTTPHAARYGKQFTITHGDYSAVICELGATFRKVQYRGKDIVVPFDENRTLSNTCQGFVLVPFPNRLKGGEYDFEGRHYSLPIDEHDRNTALHGLGYRYFWTLEALSEDSVTLSWRSPNLNGYPFDVTVAVTYTVSDEGLTVTAEARNDGDVNAPWGFGLHPYIANGGDAYGDAVTADNDRCRLELKARTHLTVDANLVPTGEEPVAGQYDLNDDPLLAGHDLDDGWTDVVRAADGTTSATLTRIDGLKVAVTGDETINAWQVFTANGMPEDQHPAGVALEPMTCNADAFNTGRHLVTLAPGATTSSTVRIHVVD